MTDTNTPMATTPAGPESISTVQPPYYFPDTGPDARTIRELTLYVSQRLEEIYFVRVKGNLLRQPAVFEIHKELATYAYIGELVWPVETKTGWMGTIIVRRTTT